MEYDEAVAALWRVVKRAAMDFAYEHDLDVEVDSTKRQVTIPKLERGRYQTPGNLTVKVEAEYEPD